MIRFVFKLVLSLAVLPVLAQSNKGLGPNDPEAKKILDAVSAKFRSFKSVKANFTLKVEGSNGKTTSSKTGNVLMKGQKYKVNVTGQEIFCDGSNVWTLDKSAKEVQVTKYDGNGNSITPQKIFTNFYDKDYLYKLNGDSKTGTTVLREIEMTPVDKTKSFFKVYLYVDKKTNTIASTKVLEKNGNKYTISISGLKTNANVPDTEFVFDAKKYPGVELIDLR
jgi:outer membrane lipoprotein-sorting protein